MKYQILTFDGGGVGGIYSTKIVSRLYERYPELINKAQLIAGTSAGSILALALAYGIPPSDIFGFYKKNLPKIFKDSYWDDIKDLGKLIGADYDYTNLKAILKNKFGDAKLKDLNKKVLIPTIDLDNEAEVNRTWKPKFYNNFQDLEDLVYDVAIKSSAAPTYFPVYQGYIDGGLAANNPSMCALALALNPNVVGQKLENISLLSIGAGYSPTFVSGKRLDWGISQWADTLIYVTLDSMEFTTEYQCKHFLNDSYCRINTIFKENIDLDDISKFDLLEEYANNFDLEPVFNWLEKYWN
jgi:patatin-like phospholipase/acyl hydrolase